MLNYLIYVSTACEKITSNELDSMGLMFAKNNERDNITGLLLYDSQYFLQVLEGEPQAIHNLLDKIIKDTRHRDLKILIESSIDQRNFPHWSMKVANIVRMQSNKTLLHIDPSSNPSCYITLIYRLLSDEIFQSFKEIEVAKTSPHKRRNVRFSKNLPSVKSSVGTYCKGLYSDKCGRNAKSLRKNNC